MTWLQNTVRQSLFSPALNNAHMGPSWYHMKLTGLFYKSPENEKETITYVENMRLYFCPSFYAPPSVAYVLCSYFLY